MRKYIPNLLILCGSGQNVGKTTIIKAMIKYISKHSEIIAIKVSPHIHNFEKNENIVWQTKELKIYIENEISGKDSSQFLQAGAKPVFYIETQESNVEMAFNKVIEIIGDHKLMICESGSVARYFKPGVLVYVEATENLNKINEKNNANKELADIIIQSTKGKINESIEKVKNKIRILDGNWELISTE